MKASYRSSWLNSGTCRRASSGGGPTSNAKGAASGCAGQARRSLKRIGVCLDFASAISRIGFLRWVSSVVCGAIVGTASGSRPWRLSDIRMPENRLYSIGSLMHKAIVPTNFSRPWIRPCGGCSFRDLDPSSCPIPSDSFKAYRTPWCKHFFLRSRRSVRQISCSGLQMTRTPTCVSRKPRLKRSWRRSAPPISRRWSFGINVMPVARARG